jgi:hypothetical protein
MCKMTELLLLPCVQQARAGEAAAQGGRRRPGVLRLGWKARDAEEREGNSWDCSPWTEEDEERAIGGQPWRSARAAMVAALRFFPDDGERQKMRSLSLRCSWRSRHRPLVLPCAESRRAGGGAWLLWRR